VQATGQKRKGSTMLGSSEATLGGEVLSPSTGASARAMSSSQRATESAKGTETRSSLTAPATTKKVLPELEPCCELLCDCLRHRPDPRGSQVKPTAVTAGGLISDAKAQTRGRDGQLMGKSTRHDQELVWPSAV
jgi:hypothetical protein